MQRTFPVGRWAAAVAALCAVLTVAACTSASPATVNTGATSHATTAAASAASTRPATAVTRTATAGTSTATTIPGCVIGVWADDFTADGHLAWQVSLRTDPSLAYGIPPEPAVSVVSDVSVFPDGGTLYALRLSDGRAAWHRSFGNAKNPAAGYVADLAVWHGLVIALVGPDGNAPKLVALDAVTGAVRWTARLGGNPLELNSYQVTTDGVAVINVGVQGRSLAAIDLDTGRQLWARDYAHVSAIASGTEVIIKTVTSGESPATLTALRGRTAKTLWTRTGYPNWIDIQPAPGGRVLVDATQIGPPRPPNKQTRYPVIALSASTGKTLWQLSTPEQPYAIWPTPDGIAIAAHLFGTTFTAPPPPQVYLADLATGKLRWSATLSEYASVDQSGPALVTPNDVTLIVATADTGTVIDYNAHTGTIRWRGVISAVTGQGRYLADPAGPNIVVTFPMPTPTQPSRLLALNATTGATQATNYLPHTSTVATLPTVAGPNVLVEPLTASCAPPVHP